MQLRAFIKSKTFLFYLQSRLLSGTGEAGSSKHAALEKCRVGKRSSGKFNRDFEGSARFQSPCPRPWTCYHRCFSSGTPITKVQIQNNGLTQDVILQEALTAETTVATTKAPATCYKAHCKYF